MRRSLLLAVLTLATLVAATASVLFGSVEIEIARLLALLSGSSDDPIAHKILFDLRMPRTIIGLSVGAILGLAGAVMQGYLRNPLADPSVLGASSSGALGAVLALYYGLAELHLTVLPAMAVSGALLSLALLFLLAGRSESPLTLILAGIAVSTLAVAAINLALNMSSNPFAAMEIMTWLMGSIENRSSSHVWIAVPCVAIGAVLLLMNGKALDALTLGEDGAKTLGIDLFALRLRLLFGIALGVGGAVAVSGSIGFVGLIVPHLIRPLTDRSPSAILVPSMLGGAALLTFADIGVRVIGTSTELKLGVVTAFLGVPVFLAYLIRERRIW